MDHIAVLPAHFIWKHRGCITELRDSIKLKLAQHQPMSKILDETTTGIKSLFANLADEVLSQLPPPPCPFAIIGIGSMARKEMSPFSDIEYAILVKEKKPNIKVFFKIFAQLMELKIIQLGETPFPILEGGVTSPTPEGIRVDVGGNSPLSEIFDFIEEPQKLALYQKPEYFIDSYRITANALRNSCLILGDIELHDLYEKEIDKILSSPSDIVLPKRFRQVEGFGTSKLMGMARSRGRCVETLVQVREPTWIGNSLNIDAKAQQIQIKHSDTIGPLIRKAFCEHRIPGIIINMPMYVEPKRILSIGQTYALALGKSTLNDFIPNAEAKILREWGFIVIKDELYRLFSHFISIVGLHFNIRENNFWDICYQLEERKAVAHTNIELLRSIMDAIVRLRYEAQLHYGEEKEVFYFPKDQNILIRSDQEDSESQRLIINKNQMKQIRRIYRFVYCFREVITYFIDGGVNELLLQVDFSPLENFDFQRAGLACFAQGDLEGAVNEFRKDLILFPKSYEKTLLMLREAESALANQNRAKGEMPLRIQTYKKKYAHLDKLLDLNKFVKIIQDLSITFRHVNGWHLSPFCYFAAHIDHCTEDELLNEGLFCFDYLLTTLKDAFPLELKQKWSTQFLDAFVHSERQKACYHEFSTETNQLNSQALCTLSQCLDELPAHLDTATYPQFELLFRIGSLLVSYVSSIEQQLYSTAKKWLIASLETVRESDNEPQIRLVYEWAIVEYLILIEQKMNYRESALDWLSTAKSLLAKWPTTPLSSPPINVLDIWSICIDKNEYISISSHDPYLECSSDCELLEDHGNLKLGLHLITHLLYKRIIFKKDQKEKEIRSSNSDPLEVKNWTGVQLTIMVLKLIFDDFVAHIPGLMHALSEYKDLDHSISTIATNYQHYVANDALVKLAKEAPVRFEMAATYAFWISLDSLGKQLSLNNPDFYFSLFEYPVTHLFSLLPKEKIPAKFKSELYYNLATKYLDHSRLKEAEEALNSSWNIEQKRLIKDDIFFNICVERGRLYKNTDRLNLAIECYTLAYQYVQEGGNPELESQLYLYDGMFLLFSVGQVFDQMSLCLLSMLSLVSSAHLTHRRQETLKRLFVYYQHLKKNQLDQEASQLLEKATHYLTENELNQLVGCKQSSSSRE